MSRNNQISQPLRIFTVYHNPLDYPGKYVVRGCNSAAGIIVNDPEPTCVVGTLAEARASIPYGMHCMPRLPGDEPPIVEVWI
jgi:hypothetical protein